MIKTFVLDTNVLLHDIDAIYNFADNRVVIPIAVIEELDNLKKSVDERGRNSRIISHRLDALRTKGKLSEGVPLPHQGILKIELDPPKEEISYEMKISSVDSRILLTALSLHQRGEKVIFISKDINLRIKAEVLGLTVQDYEKEKVDVETMYSGVSTLEVEKEIIDNFYQNKKIVATRKFSPNEFVILKNKSQYALTRYEEKENALIELIFQKTIPWGIKPLNKEQEFALELLLDDKINLVTLIGVAGSGKTLLSLACGLEKAMEEEKYRRLLICRPLIPVGRDIGYLPGTKEEKLSQWMAAIHDNLDFLFTRQSQKKTKRAVEYLFDTGKIEIEALTYIRGRTLPEQYIIIDDAQNLTPLEVKTIISRAGKDTKVVLTGDPYQIDHPYLDAASNGLTYLVERFRGQDLYGHITFTKSERSRLAALAAELL